MGEYATRRADGERIKIGTCENMYYLRYEDRNKVRKDPHSLDAASALDLRWRLPFADEDAIKPGEYRDHARGQRLYRQQLENGYCTDYSNPALGEDEKAGSIQLRHEASGLLLNVPCHHGEKLPDIKGAGWNGKGHSFELMQLKNTEAGVLPVIGCRHCGEKWRTDWADIWDFIPSEMRLRLAQYKRDAEALAKQKEIA